MESKLLIRLLALTSLTLSAAGCNGSVNLDVTDAPVDKAQNVFVQFSGVTFQPTGADPTTVTFSSPQTIDLLALKNGNTASLISGKKMRDGNYDSITLNVNAIGDGSDSYIVLKSSPSTKNPLLLSDTTGLTITGGFSVDKDKTQNYVVDFDLRKSVRDPITGTTTYLLKPALRLVDADNSGTISGTVAGAGVTGCETPAVYVYQGSSATMGDEGSTTPPYSSTLVGTVSPYTYTAAFLPPGNYTVAVACAPELDSADVAADPIVLSAGKNVTVQSGVNTTQNF